MHMSRKLFCLLAAALLVGTVFSPIIVAQEQIGILQFDPGSSGGGDEFDILNITGVNAGLDYNTTPTYVTTEVDLSNLSLSVYNGATLEATYGSSYFTLDPLDGISFDGAPEDFVGDTSAVLTGTFSPTTLTLSDSSTDTIDSDFSATISDPTGLLAGTDYVYIVATNGTSGPPPATPEPESFLMVGTGLTALAGLRRRFFMASIRKLSSGLAGLAVVLAFAGGFLLTPTSAQAQVNLAVSALPSTGLAGISSSTVTASNFPSGETPSTVTVTFATTCGGTPVATESPTSVSKYIGTIYHVIVAVPSGLASGNYYISLSGTSPSFTSNTCSEITVTATSTTLAACVPTSSLAVVAGTNVNAYVPNASWDYGYYTGIEEVPLEGSGTARTFSTPGYVNSCAANSSTGEVICTENNANVDIISGPSSTTVTTLTSGSNAEAGFSGGSCYNCGVGVNAANNTAVIAMGVTGAASNSGLQVLNLSNNTFDTPFPMVNEVSEDISIDSGRNLILSPNEAGDYGLLKIGTGNTLTEYTNSISPDGEPDSAAEDCTTGIALASDEFANDIYITDLTQATFTAGSPGTWTAPGQFFNLDDGGTYAGFAAGTCGISTAPGSGHLAVVTGEFGGNAYAALQLPSTSGSGTPTLADWAYVGSMPPTLDGGTFSAGYDPHTVTAYTSPNNNKSYAVFADYSGSYEPSQLGVVDLACVLALPRDAGTHNVTSPATATAACTRYLAVP